MVLNLINFIEVAIVWILIIPDLIFSVNCQKADEKKPGAASLTEQFGRYASMILMILPLGIWEFGFKSDKETVIYFVLNGILLFAYIFTYIFFFKKQNFALAMILAVLRILVFLTCGILLRHWVLVIFALIFTVFTMKIFLPKRNNYFFFKSHA